MASSSQSSELIFKEISSEDVKAVAELIAEAFSTSGSEPLNSWRGVERAEMLPYACLEVESSARHGLGTLCKVGEDIVGALISEDWLGPPMDVVDPIVLGAMHKFEPVFGLVEALDAKYKAELPSVKKGEVMQLLMTAVSPNFARRGIAQKLIEHNLDQARSKGFQSAFIVATGRFMQSAAKKCGFVTQLSSDSYDEFEFLDNCDFTKPFAGLTAATGHLRAELLVRRM
eukprot:TRINITY_DN94057_c0_g1_i1.p1 TRINITY_DN94057_c0_g1~~TRINITY_DN94057_c0_g1_i1.p1  ORF type:complete len:243 (-),score=55.33 TRINITY_DN94057_c0_g1_i1:26-712(-)